MNENENRIIEAIEKLEAEGVSPTQVAVREALGGGSFATIGPVLKEWKESKKEDHALAEVQVPEAITERLEQLQGAVWQAAVDEAERRLSAEREALKVAQDKAASEAAEQLEIISHLEAEAAKDSETIEVLAADVDTRTAQLNELLNEKKELEEKARDDSRAAAEALARETSRAEAAVERAERAEALHDTAQTQARAEISELKKEHKAEIEAERNAANEQVKKAESQTQTQSVRADKAEKAAQVSAASEQASKSRLEAAQGEAEQTQERLVALEEKASQAVQEAAELRGELKAIKDIKGKKNE